MILLVEIPNGSLKQYYYNVIKELHDIGLGDMSTTEDFYYNIQHCYERGLNVSECIDGVSKMQGESEWVNL